MPAAAPAAPADPADEAPAPKDMARLLVIAVIVGVVGAIGATAFLYVVHELQHVAFSSLPEALGIDGAPWWWAGIMLLIGATIVLIAQRLPGHTGASPLTGFHFDNPLAIVLGILLAALGTLIFGIALGPEAPLTVLGSALGVLLLRRTRNEQAIKAGGFLGGTAAIGAIFGNPFITAFMLLEFAAVGMMPARVIPAVLVALGSGYAIQVGVLGFAGLGVHSLAVPGLPTYDTIAVGDLLAGLIVAILAGAIALAVRMVAVWLDRWTEPRRGPALLGAALVTGLALWLAQLAGASPDLVLFSGQSGMAALVTETSLALVAVVLVAKAAGYAVALGGGLRGGPIFPATYLGVAVAIGASLLLAGVPPTPLVAAGIAACAAVMTRLPATSAILGALLVGGSGAAVAPFAILGAVAGLLLRQAADRWRAASDQSSDQSSS